MVPGDPERPPFRLAGPSVSKDGNQFLGTVCFITRRRGRAKDRYQDACARRQRVVRRSWRTETGTIPMQTVLIELTAAQAAVIRAEAWRLGMSVQEYCRLCVLSVPPSRDTDQGEKAPPAKPGGRLLG